MTVVPLLLGRCRSLMGSDRVQRAAAPVLRAVGWATRRVGRPELAVLVQEMRVRQRGSRPFAVTFGYIAILSLVTLFILDADMPGGLGLSGSDAAGLGRRVFTAISIAQLAMICLAVPAYSSGAVSDERAKGTLPLLVLTLLTSREIVQQKLGAAVAEVLVLMFTSLPVLGVVFMIGGVSPLEVLGVYLVLVATAVLLASIGMVASCALPNSRSSAFVSYLAVALHMVGIPTGLMWIDSMSRGGGFDSAMAAYPLTFLLMFAFVGGVFALAVFGLLALFARGRLSWWRNRAARMAVFGATYALLLLAMRSPGMLSAAIGSSYGYGTDVPLPLFVNPFVAITTLTSRAQLHAANAGAAVAATILFSIGAVYLLERVSVLRFEALRSS